MTPEQKRKFNTVFGGIFFAVGSIAWALTAYFAVTPNPPRPHPVLNSASVDLASCRTALGSLGYQASVKDNDVTGYEPLSGNPKLQLERATLAASVCKMSLKSFCMGEGCEQPGVTVVVTRPPVSGAAKAEAAKPGAKDAKTANTAKDGKDAKKP